MACANKDHSASPAIIHTCNLQVECLLLLSNFTMLRLVPFVVPMRLRRLEMEMVCYTHKQSPISLLAGLVMNFVDALSRTFTLLPLCIIVACICVSVTNQLLLIQITQPTNSTVTMKQLIFNCNKGHRICNCHHSAISKLIYSKKCFMETSIK